MQGRDAEKALTFIAANDVTRAPGRVTYTQMLNSRGGIECDLTLARLANDHFYIVTGTGFRTHDFGWIAAHIGAGLDARLTDVTEAWGTLSLMGPRARDILAKVTKADVSNDTFPFGHVRLIDIAGASVRALRITYVGELGYELHAPINALGGLYDALTTAGGPFGLKPAGYRALETLRLEKGYRAWGSDITPNDNPFEAGLGWAVKLKQGTPFLGREAIEKATNSKLPKQLMCFTVADPNVVLTGRETILRDGAPAGYLTSGGWGYTVGRNIGYGYVRNADGVTGDYLRAGRYSLEIASQVMPAEIHLGALYDPEMRRIKA